MQNPLQISFHDMDHSKEIDELIQEKFKRIIAETPTVTKCHVILEKQSKHHQKANMACVRLDLKVSHFDDIVVSEKCLDDKASLISAILKVFKQGLDLLHKNKKRRLDNKRVPLDDIKDVEPAEVGD